MKRVNTVNCPGINRRKKKCGNTTKQVNFAIECLFNGVEVKVVDHSLLKESNKALFNKILYRLEIEHDLELLVTKEKIDINQNKFLISL